MSSGSIASACATTTPIMNSLAGGNLEQPLELVQPNIMHPEQQQLLNTLSLFRLIAQFVQTPQPES